MIKQAYFQSGDKKNDPTPKKKQYKSDTAIVVQPRFEEPLYRNYDLYNTEGENGPPKHGPGAGLYQNMDKYKSIEDFRKKKKKLNYKAEDKYIQDDGKITSKRAERRLELLKIFAGLDSNNLEEDIVDNQIQSDPILGGNGTVADSNLTGGLTDVYVPPPDPEDKTPDKLNYGRDFENDALSAEESIKDKSRLRFLIKEIEKLLNKYITPSEPSLYGLPDGIIPKEDLDNFENKNPYYGVTDSGNLSYNSEIGEPMTSVF
jgi:hypothetical protein